MYHGKEMQKILFYSLYFDKHILMKLTISLLMVNRINKDLKNDDISVIFSFHFKNSN